MFFPISITSLEIWAMFVNVASLSLDKSGTVSVLRIHKDNHGIQEPKIAYSENGEFLNKRNSIKTSIIEPSDEDGNFPERECRRFLFIYIEKPEWIAEDGQYSCFLIKDKEPYVPTLPPEFNASPESNEDSPDVIL